MASAAMPRARPGEVTQKAPSSVPVPKVRTALTAAPAASAKATTPASRVRSLACRFRLGARNTYRTDAGLGVSEVTALPDGRLLVLERGFTSGVGNTVRLHVADRPGRGTPRGTLLPSGSSPTSATAPRPAPPPGSPSPARSSTTSRAWPSPAAPWTVRTS